MLIYVCPFVALARRLLSGARLRPDSAESAMSVDLATVKRVAHLARIARAGGRLPTLQGELNAILGFVEQLNEGQCRRRRADDLGDADGDEATRGRRDRRRGRR